ncbi:MAG: glycosyltransferase family 2 protein [Planctomycetota bacterium]|jgi:glycosyltransferase involved in cell wall biosynthesis
MAVPRISVILAVHNEEDLLSSSVSSVLEQSYTDFEFIIVDDCSTDATPEILQGITDKRLKIITNRENLGLTRSLNIGIKAAECDYIARIDSDDLWQQDHIANLLKLIDSADDIVLAGASHFEFFTESEVNLDTAPLTISKKLHLEDFLTRNQFCHSAVLFKKTVNNTIVLYREKFTRSQDYDLWLRLSSMGSVIKSDAVTCFYRRRLNALSLSSTELQIKMAKFAVKLALQRKSGEDDYLDKHSSFPALTPDEIFEIKQKTSNMLIYFALKLFRRKKVFNFLCLLTRAFLYAPYESLKQFIALTITDRN